MVKLTIDNKPIEVPEGTTILEAAEKAHISIPTLCYHEDLSPIGSCRLCTVEVSHKGKSYIVTACNYPVSDGMVVITNSEKVKNLRKMAVELLLSQCPESETIQYMDIIRPYGPLVLLALLVAGRTIGLDVIGWIMGPPLNAIFGLLIGS